jgi:DNA-nicking Smr family endonuclease
MKDDDSIYKAFSALPEFVKEKKIPLRSPHTDQCVKVPGEMAGEEDVSLSEPTVEDENVILCEAMKDVKIITGEAKRVEGQPKTKRISLNNECDPKRLLEETLLDSNTVNVTNLPEYMEGYVEGVNPITLEKLRAGEFSVQKSLDLHGHGLEEADVLFDEFVRDAVRSGLNCVRIIHGRGLKSKGIPLLKEQLKAWIVRAMHRKWVIAFSSARMRDGGPGATNILLRKKPEKKRIHIIG